MQTKTEESGSKKFVIPMIGIYQTSHLSSTLRLVYNPQPEKINDELRKEMQDGFLQNVCFRNVECPGWEMLLDLTIRKDLSQFLPSHSDLVKLVGSFLRFGVPVVYFICRIVSSSDFKILYFAVSIKHLHGWLSRLKSESKFSHLTMDAISIDANTAHELHTTLAKGHRTHKWDALYSKCYEETSKRPDDELLKYYDCYRVCEVDVDTVQ